MRIGEHRPQSRYSQLRLIKSYGYRIPRDSIALVRERDNRLRFTGRYRKRECLPQPGTEPCHRVVAIRKQWLSSELSHLGSQAR